MFDEGVAYEIEACADGVCTVEPVTAYAPPPTTDDTLPATRAYFVGLPPGDYSSSQTVEVVVTRVADQVVVLDMVVDADFERLQPNGPDCPPICWMMLVEL